MNGRGFAEVAIVVSDIERSTRFYVDVLGYEVFSADNFVPPRGARLIKVGADSILGLWEPGVWFSDYLGESFAGYFGSQIGQAHLVMGIDQADVATTAERLTAAGYEIAGPMPHGDGSLHLYVTDPDGHAIEFWGKSD
ncbi:MAG: VOC family protein [Chloroflexi bacterium]|nr:VOC family protein [Chloroflexota bacterium]